MKRFILSLLLVLLASQAEAASTWWVRASGGSTGTCAQAKGASDPGFYLRTFAALNACSGPAFVGGDTVMIKGGTYTEFSGHTAGFTIPSGSIGAPTILQAVGTEVVTFTGAGGAANAAFYFNGKSYISLIGDAQAKNFVLDMNSATCLSAIQMAGAANHIVMRGLDVWRCNSGNGLSMFFGSGNNTVQSSRFHHNGGVQVGTEQSHAIYLDTSNNLLEDIELDNNSGYGLHCNDAGLATNNTFNRFNIHHNGTTTAAGLLVCSGTGNKYYNMKIWGNTGARGIQIDAGSTAILKSMTLYNNAGTEIFIRPGVTGGSFENFIVSNSIGSLMINNQGSGITFTKISCTAAGTGCTSTGNPLFVNAPNGNFHLQSGSPVKTGGTILGSPYGTDFDIVSRGLQGDGTYAYGALEFVGVAPPPAELVLQLSGDNVATDSSGKANNGTLTGGATYGTGKYNTGFSLDGVNDYVSVADHSTLDLNQFSLEAWVNLTTVDAVDRVVIAKSGAYFLYATSSNPTCLSGIRGGFLTTSGVQAVCYGIPLTAGLLTHLAAIYDGTTLLLYVNGSLVTSQAASGTVVTNSNPVTIGAATAEFLQGGIDEVRIYSYARSSGEIITDRDTPINPVIPPAAVTAVRIGTGVGALRCGTGAGACRFGMGS